ncbi:MAG TPA: hypothetical protein VMG10_28375 [Gemmataceae bacterium]|nr:hypothetical protein [Gemmataceae bacterium]
MIEIFLNVLALANAPKSGNQANRIVRFNHQLSSLLRGRASNSSVLGATYHGQARRVSINLPAMDRSSRMLQRFECQARSAGGPRGGRHPRVANGVENDGAVSLVEGRLFEFAPRRRMGRSSGQDGRVSNRPAYSESSATRTHSIRAAIEPRSPSFLDLGIVVECERWGAEEGWGHHPEGPKRFALLPNRDLVLEVDKHFALFSKIFLSQTLY